MKTLREIELEYQVLKLQRQLYAAESKPFVLSREDDINDVNTFDCGYKEIPLFARVGTKYTEEKLQIILRSYGNEAISMGYYVDKIATPTRHHLEQALVSMHEKLIYDIVKMRADEN